MKRFSALMIATVLLLLVLAYGVGVMTRHQPLEALDESTLQFVLDHRDPTRSGIVVLVTALFGPLWVAVMTMTAAGVAFVADRTVVRALTIVATVSAAGGICEILKVVVHRARPPAIDQITTVETVNSYPSGHVTGIAAPLLVLAVIITHTTLTRSIAIISALALTAVVAATRLYMAAHWLTDVSAAVALAGAAALTVPVAVRGVVLRFPIAATGTARHRHPAQGRHESR